MDTQKAVTRLNSQLPLKARQKILDKPLINLHQNILYTLIKKGRAPTDKEISQLLGGAKAAEAIQTLSSADLVVLDAEMKGIVGAYPITAERTPHSISVNDNNIYAMCALDAVSVAPMFDVEVQIESSCHVNKTPIYIHMNGKEILDKTSSSDIVVGIRWQLPQGTAARSMCMEMVFLDGHTVASQWQNGDEENVTLFSLEDAVEFGYEFFHPILL